MTLKKLLCDAINELASLDSLKGECVSCSCDINNFIMKPLINIFFNILANNFTMALNRKK